jgi:hypothetical protein
MPQNQASTPIATAHIDRLMLTEQACRTDVSESGAYGCGTMACLADDE